MTVRIAILFTLLIAAMLAAGAKGLPKPAELLTKSDNFYYFPADMGVVDLAVEAVIDQYLTDPVAKAARVECFYAKGQQPWVEVSNLTPEQDAYRIYPQRILTPLLQYIIPIKATESFANMILQMQKVTRFITDVPNTNFYLLAGSVPPPSEDEVKKDDTLRVAQYRVLLDADGQLYQIENVMSDRSVISASVTTIQIGDHHYIARITTRLPMHYITGVASDNGILWKIDEISYDNIQGFTMPTKITVEYRDGFNKPIADLGAIQVDFTNYRINQGIAAAAIKPAE